MRIASSAMSCILMIVLAMPASLSGQTATGQDRKWAALAGIQPGSGVELKMKDGEAFKGNFIGVSETSVSLTRDSKTVDLEKDKIAMVWTVKRSFKKPVLIGTAIGAGAGVGIGIAAGGCKPRDILCFDRKATVPIGAAVFGIVGALSGLVVGLLHHYKIVVYQAS